MKIKALYCAHVSYDDVHNCLARAAGMLYDGGASAALR